MIDARWQRRWDLFHEALEKTPDQRAAFLDQACGDDRPLRDDLDRLLASHEQGSGILDTPEPGDRLEIDDLQDPLVGERIGPYRVREVIGEGGMGIVYDAEQAEPVRRRVALKLIRLGMDTREVVTRFEAERQALALMSHPGIARVFDAGATEHGRPYFVMEHVEGVPITRYCDEQRLDMRQRLELVLRVCDAIQHAHQKGIIHRDIKPSNVLVARQNGKHLPKIIDFGVAKATGARLTEKTMFTSTGAWVGTPEYMSPEQAEIGGLDVDTRTDVYSLGVLLYELLVGALPFDARRFREASLDEIRRTIREEEPSKPSARLSTLDGDTSSEVASRRRTDPPALRRQLSGDLDWITIKALEKDRTRRYGSVFELGADIARHLRHEPVSAGPPGATYRMRKFVRRHRAGVSFAALAGVFLVALAVTMTIQTGRIASERDRADGEAGRAGREAETARQVSDFLVNLFKVSDPSKARGNTITAREILDRGAERIERELQDEPEIRARLLANIGIVYMNLGLYDESGSALEQALTIRRELHGERHPDVASSLNDLAALRQAAGDLQEALALYLQAVDIREHAQEPDDLNMAISLTNLATVLAERGRHEESLAANERALAIFERTFGPDHPRVALGLRNLGTTYLTVKDLEAARSAFERALPILEKASPPNDLELAAVLNGLAIVHWEQKNYAAARPPFERSLAILEQVYPPNHPYVLQLRNNVARLMADMGDYGAARPLYEHTLAEQEKALGPDHPEVATTLANLASLLRETGDFAGAKPLYERAIRIREDKLGPEHPRLEMTLGNYAKVLRHFGEIERAEELELRVQAIREKQARARESSARTP